MSKLRLRMHSLSILPFAIPFTVLLIFPLSLFLQTSSFSLSLDMDRSVGDQGVTSLAVSSDQDVSIQIFGRDVQNTSRLAVRFAYDATQVIYKGVDGGQVLPNAQTLIEQDSTTVLRHGGTSFVEISLASLDEAATVNTGLLGTLRFRTTDAFSDTEIRLVRSELDRDEQSETVILALRVALQGVAASSPDFDGSGVVDFPDFLAFVSAFGSQEGQEKYDAKYDLDSNGKIAFDDFLIFVSSFGKAVNNDINQPQPRATKSVASTSDVVSVCDRTPQVRDAIVDEISGVSACGDVTADHLAAITRLGVVSRGLSALKASDFSGLSSLEGLYLNGNELTTVDASVFSGLPALETLLLWGNQFSELEVGVFSNLSALKTLSLSRNQFSTLKAGIFSGLTTLQSVDLANNQLTTLETDVFSDLTALRKLDLSNNQFSTLNVGIFSDLSALRSLDLSNNQLTTLKAGVFSGLSALTRLDLPDNQLTTLETGVFSDLSALTMLTMSHNRLSMLESGVFSGLTALTWLNLSHNRLSALESGVFSGLTALEMLGVQNNAVDPLPITISLELVEAGQFKAKAHTGAPFDMVLPIRIANGTLVDGQDSIAISTGRVASDLQTVSRTPGTVAAVTVDIGALPDPPGGATNLSAGYALVKSEDLPLVVLEAPRGPREVGDVTLTSTYAGQIEASWTAPSETPRDYRISWAKVGENFISHQGGNAYSTEPAYTITGLEGGTEYKVRVRARYNRSAGAWSAEATVTVVTAPEAPRGPREVGDVTLTSTYAGQIEASWVAPSETPRDYRISWAKVGENFISHQDGNAYSTEPTYTITGLEGGTEYKVRVRARYNRSAGAWSAEATVTVVAASPNQAPRFTSAETFTVTENTAPATTVGTVSAEDADEDDNITGYGIVDGADGSQFEINDQTGVLTFKAAPNYESPADVAVTDPANDGSNNEYIVFVKATGGTGARALTVQATITVTVEDVTEVPGKPSALTLAEATLNSLTISWTAPTNTGPAITAYDVRYILSSATDKSDANWTEVKDAWTSSNGGNLEYTISDLSPDTSYDVQVCASNDEGTSDWSASVIETTKTNVAPVFTSVSAFTVNENSTGIIVTVTARDADADDNITGYEISDGADQAKFSIDSTTGALSFKEAPNFENPTDVESTTPVNAEENNEYIVVVEATSGTGDRALTATQTLTVTVSDVNEAPVISSNDAFDVVENTTQVGTVEADDVDGADSITGYTISGGADQDKFSIVSSTGVLSFTAAPDYENPTDVLSATPSNDAANNEYIVVVETTGGAGARAETVSQTLTVTVTDAGVPGKPATPTVASVTFNSLTISWTAPDNTGPEITAYDVRHILSSASEQDKKKHSNWTAKENAWTSDPGGNLEFTIGSLEQDTSYDVQVRAKNAEGPGVASDTVVGMTSANQAPVFTSASAVSVNENSTGIIVTVTARDADADDNITGYEISDGADQAKFSIDSTTGALSFKEAPNFENPTDVESTTPVNAEENNEYIVVVEATSGTGDRALTATQTLTVTVSDVNEAPVISSNDAFDVVENTTQVGTVEADDVDSDDSITGYTLSGGADQDKFSIVSSTGVLSFTAAPDYENPTDVASTTPANDAANNEYMVEVTATGGAGARAETVSQTITVTVTDAGVPGKPATPTVASLTFNSLTISWTAPPDNTGPEITAYDVRHILSSASEQDKADDSKWMEQVNAWTSDPGGDLEFTIGSLELDTSYDMQVRAENAEGTGDWSDTVVGMTSANQAPVFTSASAVSVNENSTGQSLSR